MKRNLLLAIAFLVVFLVTDRAIFYVLDSCAQKSAYVTASGQVQSFLKLNQSCHTLILGASTARHGIVPTELSSESWCLAWPATGDDLALCILDLLVNKSMAPKRVFLVIETDSYYTGPSGPGLQLKDGAQLLRVFYDDSSIIRDLIGRASTFERLKFLSLSYRYNPDALLVLNSVIKNFRADKDVHLETFKTHRGYSPLKGATDQQAVTDWKLKVLKQDNLERKSQDADYRFEPKRLDHLKKMIDFCDKNNIELKLVLLPWLLKPRKDGTSARKELEFLAANRPGVDMVDLSDARLPWDAWGDRYHLSASGAKAITERLDSLDEAETTP